MFTRRLSILAIMFFIPAIYFARPYLMPRLAIHYPTFTAIQTPLDHWHKQAQPILVADQAWEQGVISEPTVLHTNNLWRMWYTGGWSESAIGYAESSDGLTWTKYGPIVGMGAGAFAGPVGRSSMTQSNGAFYLFFSDVGDRTALYASMSQDGRHFEQPRRILSPSVADTALANSAVWVEDGRWHMIYESRDTAGLWSMFLAEGDDAFHWRRMGPIQGVSIGGSSGGPTITKVDGLYQMWYHAAPSGDLPTDLYHATSSDLLHWTRVADAPVLTRDLAVEVDQVADPWRVEGRLYYSAMDNVKPAGAIMVAFDR